MRFTINVPKDKVHIIRLLENTAKQQKQQKSDLILDAIERYLCEQSAGLGLFNLGESKLPNREKLYESRLDF
ncbi:MAG: hypothetical protein SCK29_11260 [Bacillota bacterium]|nr:hypothetical protein [Bacillota bacterium]MDW7684683.1 hypothetical protein [Bacillota bacterium]